MAIFESQAFGYAPKEAVMIDADFWLEQANAFSARAETAQDVLLQRELWELAAVCETVAAKIEEHAPSG
jgi:hypothetical protein